MFRVSSPLSEAFRVPPFRVLQMAHLPLLGADVFGSKTRKFRVSRVVFRFGPKARTRNAKRGALFIIVTKIPIRDFWYDNDFSSQTK